MGKSHRKGYGYEKKVADKLKVVWPEAERAHAGRVLGDLVGTGKFFVECKNQKQLQPGTWIQKLEGIHPRGCGRTWILVMRGGGSARYYGDITVIPLGPNLNGVLGYNLFRFTDFLMASGSGFIPEVVTYHGNNYYVQTLEAMIARLKSTGGTRAVPMKSMNGRAKSPLS